MLFVFKKQKSKRQKRFSTDMIKPGEIVHCNLTFVNKKKNIIFVNDAILGRPYEGEFKTKYSMSSSEDERDLMRFKIYEDVELTKVDVIKSLGFKVKQSGYSEVKKNETDMRRQKSGGYV